MEAATPVSGPGVGFGDGLSSVGALSDVAHGLGGLSIAATDAGRIDQIRVLEDLKAACAAAQARVTAEFAASQRAAAAQSAEALASDPADVRAPSVGETRAQSAAQLRAKAARLARRSAAAQVALARRESPARGGRYVGMADVLVDDMPATLAALSAGVINERRATIIVREAVCLDADERRALDTEIAHRLDGLGDVRLEALVRRIAYRMQPAAVTDRAVRATRDRRVSLRPAPDAMAYLTMLLPLAPATAAYASLKSAADAHPGDDGRTHSQRMADVAVERITAPGSSVVGGAPGPVVRGAASSGVRDSASPNAAAGADPTVAGGGAGAAGPVGGAPGPDAAGGPASPVVGDADSRVAGRSADAAGRSADAADGADAAGRAADAGDAAACVAGAAGPPGATARADSTGATGAAGGAVDPVEAVRQAYAAATRPGRTPRTDRAVSTTADPAADPAADPPADPAVAPASGPAPSPYAFPPGTGVVVNLVMTDSALLADGDEPALLSGNLPLPAPLARRMLAELPPEANVWIRRLYTPSDAGQLVAMDSKRRAFPPSMRRFLLARDLDICRTPWCDAPARHADHVRPHASGGPTSIANGQSLSEDCNYTRTAHGWSARARADAIAVMTPTGHEYRSPTPEIALRPAEEKPDHMLLPALTWPEQCLVYELAC